MPGLGPNCNIRCRDGHPISEWTGEAWTFGILCGLVKWSKWSCVKALWKRNAVLLQSAQNLSHCVHCIWHWKTYDSEFWWVLIYCCFSLSSFDLKWYPATYIYRLQAAVHSLFVSWCHGCSYSVIQKPSMFVFGYLDVLAEWYVRV